MYTPDNFKVKRLEAQIAETEATVRSERADIVSALRSGAALSWRPLA